MKSKIPLTSKNTPATSEFQAASLAVGHRPAVTLKPQDEALFRAFQANLLSLVSHELRTPLTAILGALHLLEAGEKNDGLSSSELVKIAKQNAQRLHLNLAGLLDLAELESGTFHARLREVDLARLAQSRMEEDTSLAKNSSLKFEWKKDADLASTGSPVLADPQKMGRAIDLCLQVIVPRTDAAVPVKLRISSHTLEFHFKLKKDSQQSWESEWSQSLIGFQSGISSPFSAFSGVVQSEEGFLTRTEEGLGNEFLLIHEIMRIHEGKFTAENKNSSVKMSLSLRDLSSDEGLKAVLASRAYSASTGLSSVALVLISIPNVKDGRDEVKKHLLRSTDAMYWLPRQNLIAVVLDDCLMEDVELFVQNIRSSFPPGLALGMAQCPTDGLDPASLLEIAEHRLSSS